MSVDTENSLWPEPIEEKPGYDELSNMMLDGVAAATDGCTVETDGICEHGYPSWLIQLGVI